MAYPLREHEVTGGSVVREESTLHLLARESRVVMQAVMVVSGIATVIFMMTIWPAAYVTGAIAAMAFAWIWVAEWIERRSTAGEEIERAEVAKAVEEAMPQAAVEPEEIVETESVEVVKREGWIVGIVIAAAAIIALTIGLIVFDRTMVAIGAFVFFLYAILITWPAWLTWLEEDADAHTPGAPEAIR